MQYADPTEAGYQLEAIDSLTKLYNESGASALMIVAGGKVVFSKGETSRRFMAHSIRKSFMSALVGIAIDQNEMDLNHTLQDLAIDDIQPLTDIEKKATIADLLKACSGVYLPSAYSPENMIKNLPVRGSAVPGSKWFYNNWDFNALVTIYNQETKRDFFQDFKNKIAGPIGMEDFRLMDSHYRYENDKSMHPAYLFKMSARDMARFGQLYLNKGKWEDRQIVPSSWIGKSTSKISRDLGSFDSREGYGYLWWSATSPIGSPMFYASGVGGHRIYILPEEDMVIVIRANTYENRMISGSNLYWMLEYIVHSRTKVTVSNPSLKPYNPKANTVSNVSTKSMDLYCGSYVHSLLGKMEIVSQEGEYLLINNAGKFILIPTAQDKFYVEDLQLNLKMIKVEEADKKGRLEVVFNPDRSIKEVLGYY
jgi:CubicO group peptidase (beta-lactamase class C family)